MKNDKNIKDIRPSLLGRFQEIYINKVITDKIKI